MFKLPLFTLPASSLAVFQEGFAVEAWKFRNSGSKPKPKTLSPERRRAARVSSNKSFAIWAWGGPMRRPRVWRGNIIQKITILHGDVQNRSLGLYLEDRFTVGISSTPSPTPSSSGLSQGDPLFWKPQRTLAYVAGQRQPDVGPGCFRDPRNMLGLQRVPVMDCLEFFLQDPLTMRCALLFQT